MVAENPRRERKLDMSRKMRKLQAIIVCLAAATGCKLAPIDSKAPSGLEEETNLETTGTAYLREKPLSDEELAEIIKDFSQRALGGDLVEVCGHSEPKSSEFALSPRQTFKIRNDTASAYSTVIIETHSGFITTYAKEGSASGKVKAESAYDCPVSAEHAFQTAKPVLQWYKLPLDPHGYYIDEYSGERPSEHWSIRRQLVYKGVPCRARMIEILVSKHAPRIEMVMCLFPIIPPDRKVVEVSKKRALDKTEDWLGEIDEIRQNGLRYEVARKPEAVRLVLTPPLNIPFQGVEQPEARGYIAAKLYYAWGVPVTLFVNDRAIDYCVYVDSGTGDIITCGGKKDGSQD